MFRKLHTTKINDYASERGTGSGSASSSEHAIGSDGTDSMEQICTLLIYKCMSMHSRNRL
jgi:hypothetical protein